MPPAPRVVLLEDVERAFPDAQSGSTRLVLTQSLYLLQTWIDFLDEGAHIVATADRAALEHGAPEATLGRGPWARFEVVDLDSHSRINTEDTSEPDLRRNPPLVSAVSLVPDQGSNQCLARAFAAGHPVERLRLCREASSLAPQSAVAWLALASACRETPDGTGAREALDRAATLAPDWEAVAYERGKLCLVNDDMAGARNAFQCAVDLMPTFSAAWSNLGATLGELDEPGAALIAFRHALAHDPLSFTIFNNIGVVCRELAQLDDSQAAFRRAIAINPAFVFGHYNLGHTLFLAGNYPAALSAYEEGQRRDPQQNRRQGCRIAVVRFANGDVPGAERDLWRFADAAPPDEREALLLEAYEVVQALIAAHPTLALQRPFLDRIGSEIAKSE